MFLELRKLTLTAAVAFLTMCVGVVHADTFEVRVAATSDDAEENIGPGSMESLDSSDLELGVENVPGGAEGIQLAGMRFLGVDGMGTLWHGWTEEEWRIYSH